MKKNIEFIFRTFADNDPSPATELEYPNHFCLLVAIVLSAQATDIGVNKATKQLFKIADTPQKMLDLGLNGIKQHIKTIGLYNAKAKNIIGLCQILLEEYGGIIPNDRKALERLPGVGQKTASVMLNCAFGADTIAVDTHVLRVSNRIGLIREKNANKAENKLTEIIPKKWRKNAHHWLILHGRYVCKARTPLCTKCSISEYCYKLIK